MNSTTLLNRCMHLTMIIALGIITISFLRTSGCGSQVTILSAKDSTVGPTLYHLSDGTNVWSTTQFSQDETVCLR